MRHFAAHKVPDSNDLLPSILEILPARWTNATNALFDDNRFVDSHHGKMVREGGAVIPAGDG